MNSDLGAWIRDSREAKGWTQTQVGLMLGVSQARVSQWETAKDSPGDEELRQLEIAFGAPAGTWSDPEAHSAVFEGTSPPTREVASIVEKTSETARSDADPPIEPAVAAGASELGWIVSFIWSIADDVPDFDVKSVNYDFAKLLARAGAPS